MAVVFIKKEWIFVVLELYLHTNFCWEYWAWFWGGGYCHKFVKYPPPPGGLVLQRGFDSLVRVVKRYEAWGLTLYVHNVLD